VSSTGFTGALTGNATTATSATNTAITEDVATAVTVFPTWVTANTGNLPQKTTSTKLYFVPSSGILTATGFTGNLTGNITGTASNVTGTIIVANGGTGLTSGSSGGIPYYSSSSAISSSGTLAQFALIIGGGSGSGPSSIGGVGSSTTVLHGNAVGPPSFGAVSLTTDVSGTLPVLNGGTGSTTQNFVDLTNNQTIAGSKTFSSLPVFSTLTPGSIPFAGTGGLISQDNANLFWDKTNHRLGIGRINPTALLHLNAGASAAGSAPLKFTSGPVLTAPEPGAIEFLTDIYYATITTGSARKTFAFNESPSLQTPNIDVATGTSLTVTGSITSSGKLAGIGYSTGAGATTTQVTNKSTPVTINAICGGITMNNASLGNGSSVTFQVNNSTVSNTDVPVVAIQGGTSGSSYLISVGLVTSGTFMITIRNISGGSLSESVIINFVIIKAANI